MFSVKSIIYLFIFFWSIAIACFISGISHATPSLTIAQATRVSDIDPAGGVDIVPPRYQLGQELYVENCGTCHIAFPPQVMPTETWQKLLQDPQHYGQQIKLPIDPPRLLIWNYIQVFSRTQPKAENIPYRIAESRYFKILHPDVKFTEPVKTDSCVSCHLQADQFNFRKVNN